MPRISRFPCNSGPGFQAQNRMDLDAVRYSSVRATDLTMHSIEEDWPRNLYLPMNIVPDIQVRLAEIRDEILARLRDLVTVSRRRVRHTSRIGNLGDHRACGIAGLCYREMNVAVGCQREAQERCAHSIDLPFEWNARRIETIDSRRPRQGAQLRDRAIYRRRGNRNAVSQHFCGPAGMHAAGRA